jgi:hypothetical protein
MEVFERTGEKCKCGGRKKYQIMSVSVELFAPHLSAFGGREDKANDAVYAWPPFEAQGVGCGSISER